MTTKKKPSKTRKVGILFPQITVMGYHIIPCEHLAKGTILAHPEVLAKISRAAEGSRHYKTVEF